MINLYDNFHSIPNNSPREDMGGNCHTIISISPDKKKFGCVIVNILDTSI